MPPRSKRALLWTSTTYFGEGLPWSFLHQMGTEFLTAIGASKTQIGSTSLLHLAVTFKFAWSPALDLFGKRRTWLWVLQLVLGLGMFAVAAVAPSRNLTAFWLMVSALAIVHATHDIACDGFYLQALDKHGQALYSGTRLGAYRLAMIVGSSVLVVLAGKTSWLWGFAAAGVLMILTAVVNAAIMPHPPERAPAGQVAADGAHRPPAVAFIDAFRSFITQPQAALVLSFMLFYRLGDIMMFAMSKPLLRDLGVDTAHRGLLNGLGTGASILGVVLGGAFVARRGLARALVPLIYVQNLGIPLYIGMAVWKPHLAGHHRHRPRRAAGGRVGDGGGHRVSHATLPSRILRVAFCDGDLRGVAGEHVLRVRLRSAQRAAGTPALLHGGVPGQHSQPGAGPAGAEDVDRS